MKKLFRVPDMHCPNCSMALQGLEDDLPGVRSVSASYKKGLMEVEFDDTRLTVQEILSAANALGYHPEPVE